MLILGLAPIAFVAAAIGIVTSIITLSQDLWKGVKEIERINEARTDEGDHYQPSTDPLERNIMTELRYLSKKNDQFLVELENAKEEIIDRLTETIPELVELNRRLATIIVNSKTIHKSYNEFLDYFEHSSKYDQDLITDFSLKTIAGDSCGLPFLLRESHTLLVLNDGATTNTIDLLTKHYKTYLQYSNVAQSPQQFLYNLHGSVVFTELKGLFALKYSYELLHRYKHGNYSEHIKNVENDFNARVNKTVDTFKRAMVDLSREVIKKDPPEHKENVTFIELKQAFQQYMINEYDLEPYQNCWKKCHEYAQVAPKTPTCYHNKQFCESQNACKGGLYDCKYMIEPPFHVCLSDKNNTRRYEYIETESGQTYGTKNKSCEKPEVKYDLENAKNNLANCYPCMCICADQTPKTINKFSLAPSLVNCSNNYVVTGARFINVNNIIYIQVQQAKQLPNGHINETSIEWVPINTTAKEVYTLDWKSSREVMLDDVHAPKDHVLLGLTFHSVNGRLTLKTFTGPLNYTSGNLTCLNNEIILFNETKDELSIQNLNAPALKGVDHNLVSKLKKFIKFEPTSFLNDLGQHTIPFMDIQEVTTNPPTAMSGVGLYHKTIVGSGGFLGLRLFTFDVEPFMQPDLPGNPEDDSEDDNYDDENNGINATMI